MKILVWGINYAPEISGIAPFNTALCEYLATRGHQVTMLTTFAYYPEWKRRPEDVDKFAETKVVNGVTVSRVWHYIPSKPSALKRIIHEGSFLVLVVPESIADGKIRRGRCPVPASRTRAFRVALLEAQRHAVCFSCAGSSA